MWFVCSFLLYLRVADNNHDMEAEVENMGELEGREEEEEEEEVTSKLTKCLAKWQDKSSRYPTLSSLLDRENDLACLHLQVIYIYMEQGRATGDIIVTDGELYCTAKLGVSRYLEYLRQQQWGLYSIISVRETRGGFNDLVIVSYSKIHQLAKLLIFANQ